MAREYSLHTHTNPGPKIDFRAELNPQQYEAVVCPPGQALVIAGAGSGKTRTLIYRVAYLLANGVLPEQILLLTFTNKAAREMLERVQGLLSIETADSGAARFTLLGIVSFVNTRKGWITGRVFRSWTVKIKKIS